MTIIGITLYKDPFIDLNYLSILLHEKYIFKVKIVSKEYSPLKFYTI